MFPFWFLRRRRRAKALIARPSIGGALLRAAVLVTTLATLHVLAMMAYEAMPAFDAFWLTLTTLFTVGYGDIAAKTFEGRWATIVLLYFGGIFTLANFASQWFEWRTDAHSRKWRGLWRWRMKEHLVILNSPADHPQEYFERLVQQLRLTPNFAQCPILIITRAFEQGLPESLAKRGVAHVTAWGLDFHALRDASAEHARAIAILAKSEIEPTSDSITLDAITRVRAVSQAHLVVECLDERNRARMTRAGASAVIRPSRVYPEIMARALSHRGSEKVLEEILDAGGTECTRIDEAWEGSWRDLARRFAERDAGTPIGYEDLEGNVHVNPRQGEQVRARAIFALVNEEGAGAGAGKAPYDRRAA